MAANRVVMIVKENVPDLSDRGLYSLMEDALLMAEISRVDAINRKRLLAAIWKENEHKAGRVYESPEALRAADAYADGEAGRDSLWKKHASDNNWFMTRASTYAAVLAARVAYKESIK